MYISNQHSSPKLRCTMTAESGTSADVNDDAAVTQEPQETERVEDAQDVENGVLAIK